MTQIDRCNQLLENAGRNPFGEPLYKWVRASQLTLHRYRVGKDDWQLFQLGTRRDGSTVALWVPNPVFQEVPAFPHLADRWVLCIWQFYPPAEWDRQFGTRTVYPNRGFYFPTDKIMRPGKVPDIPVTEYFLRAINYSRTRSLADFEQEGEDILDQEEKDSFNEMYSKIEDALTAYGNDPGKKSGGVSFPSKEASIAG